MLFLLLLLYYIHPQTAFPEGSVAKAKENRGIRKCQNKTAKLLTNSPGHWLLTLTLWTFFKKKKKKDQFENCLSPQWKTNLTEIPPPSKQGWGMPTQTICSGRPQWGSSLAVLTHQPLFLSFWQSKLFLTLTFYITHPLSVRF